MQDSPMIDHGARLGHKLRNILQSVLLLGGMLSLLSLCAWILFGVEGMLWSVVALAIGLLLAPRISPTVVLRLYRAQRLDQRSFPQGVEILSRLARRAGLEFVPALYYQPNPVLNAFAIGRRDEAAIVVTDGLLRALGPREFAGVLAHEVSHIRNNDLWLMNLADAIGRLTNMMTMVGGVLLMLNLPLLLAGWGHFPWLLVFLLLLAPTFASLLQLGLSRAREYDADLDAAALTGDPAGLASALAKLERHHAGMWERVLMPGRNIPDPSLLRTHPPTEERIERLLSLYPQHRPIVSGERPVFAGTARPVVTLPPRWRITGLWH